MRFTSGVTNGDYVDLPSPKFGDSHTINWNRINRTTRGNELILATPDSNWQPSFLHKYDYEYLSDADKLKFKAFLARHVGLPVYITGFYTDETIKVIFLRPDLEISQIGRQNRAMTVDCQVVQ